MELALIMHPGNNIDEVLKYSKPAKSENVSEINPTVVLILNFPKPE